MLSMIITVSILPSDLDKRNLAKDILQRNKDIASIFIVLPNGRYLYGRTHIGIKKRFQELILLIENGIKELSKVIKPILVQFSCLLL